MARHHLGATLAWAMGCTAATPPPVAANAEPPPSVVVPPSAAAAPSTPGAVADGTTGLTITNVLPGQFELTVNAPLGVASAARIERRGDDGGWRPIEDLDRGAGFRLTASCEVTPPACVELSTATTLWPVPLTGHTCSSQCNGRCRANGWLGPGVLRLSVDTCDGRTVVGPPFELPDADHARSLVRWGLTRDAVRASIMRLHDPDASKDRVAPDPLVMWRVRAGTERPLDPAAFDRLLALLADGAGYDDDIQKRCAMDRLVGFRLVRAPASTGPAVEETVEIAVDFACAKLFVLRGDEGGRPIVEHATHFDPSRAAWLALVRAALPDDRELAKER